MRHYPTDDDDLPGQDSFLDIVANIVGILIILVMVVGVRASYGPVLASTTKVDHRKIELAIQTAADLALETEELDQQAESIRLQADKDSLEARQSQSAIAQLAQRIAQAEVNADQRDEERVEYQSIIQALREDMQRHINQLGTDQQEELALEQKLTEAQSQLEDLLREQATLEMDAETVETIENLPTPLSKIVDGDEIHLRLRKGYVAVIPIEKLYELRLADAEVYASRLDSQPSYKGRVGPIDGFRLEYILEKMKYSVHQGGESRKKNSIVFGYTSFLPISEVLGTPAELALSKKADLGKLLVTLSPKKTTITIWTYADSFPEFRALKKELFQLGYAVACRPMYMGATIASSPGGTASSAQ